ncbi:MAG TPA: tail fiber protein [Azospira sp.]|nr:tail fiber protein [Azospira sp.]
MSDPFYGEIRPFAFNFAPVNWAICSGQSMSIPQNQVLYTVIGTRYGGDGQTYFKLPNLQGRVPMGNGTGPGLSPRTLGEVTGSMSESLLQSQLPPHSHALNVQDGNATVADPANAYWAKGLIPGSRPTLVKTYTNQAANSTMASGLVGNAGAGQAHGNAQPYLTLNLCICLEGDYPTPA